MAGVLLSNHIVSVFLQLTTYLPLFDNNTPPFLSKYLTPLSFSHSYTGRVVGNGLHAQRQNPEVKVRSPNPTLAEVKERLERFNQVGPQC